MPRPRDPFSHALDNLRSRATGGVWKPGAPVVIIDEARRLGLSTTPVREALAWLCGEGLMERAPRAGYLLPRLDASLLRDRLWLRLRCLTASLELTEDLTSSVSAEDDGGDEMGVKELFERLIRATGNRALIDSYLRVDAQLRMVTDAESRVFLHGADEGRELVRLAGVGSRGQLAAGIAAFHRRRIDNAALLVLEHEGRDWPRPGEI